MFSNLGQIHNREGHAVSDSEFVVKGMQCSLTFAEFVVKGMQCSLTWVRFMQSVVSTLGQIQTEFIRFMDLNLPLFLSVLVKIGSSFLPPLSLHSLSPSLYISISLSLSPLLSALSLILYASSLSLLHSISPHFSHSLPGTFSPPPPPLSLSLSYFLPTPLSVSTFLYLLKPLSSS